MSIILNLFFFCFWKIALDLKFKLYKKIINNKIIMNTKLMEKILFTK